jgi:hypothetical protein
MNTFLDEETEHDERKTNDKINLIGNKPKSKEIVLNQIDSRDKNSKIINTVRQPIMIEDRQNNTNSENDIGIGQEKQNEDKIIQIENQIMIENAKIIVENNYHAMNDDQIKIVEDLKLIKNNYKDNYLKVKPADIIDEKEEEEKINEDIKKDQMEEKSDINNSRVKENLINNDSSNSKLSDDKNTEIKIENKEEEIIKVNVNVDEKQKENNTDKLNDIHKEDNMKTKVEVKLEIEEDDNNNIQYISDEDEDNE